MNLNQITSIIDNTVNINSFQDILKIVKQNKNILNPYYVSKLILIKSYISLKYKVNFNELNEQIIIEYINRNSSIKKEIAILLVCSDFILNRLNLKFKQFIPKNLAISINKLILQLSLMISKRYNKDAKSQVNKEDDNMMAFQAITWNKQDKQDALYKHAIHTMQYSDIEGTAQSIEQLQLALCISILGPINEETSKLLANKLGILKEYLIIFNSLEFSKYIIDSIKEKSFSKDLLLIRAVAVIKHYLYGILHKYKLSSLSFILHILSNLFMKVVYQFVYTKIYNEDVLGQHVLHLNNEYIKKYDRVQPKIQKLIERLEKHKKGIE